MNGICGKNIYLMPITNDDTAKIVRWRNNKKVSSRFIQREELTSEKHKRWIKTKVETGEVLQFIIYEKQNKRAIGTIYLNGITDPNNQAELGIFIGEDDATSKGYGSEATALICNYAKNNLHMRRLILRVFKDNEIAINCYKQAGFIFLETIVGVLCSDGEIKDMIVMENNLS